LCSSSGEGLNTTHGTKLTRSFCSPSSRPLRVSRVNLSTFLSVPLVMPLFTRRPANAHTFICCSFLFLPRARKNLGKASTRWLPLILFCGRKFLGDEHKAHAN